jgi:hypothetical protein
MKKGMVFDLYQDGQSTKRVMAISSNHVLDLETHEVIENIDFEYEVESILIDNIFQYGMYPLH